MMSLSGDRGMGKTVLMIMLMVNSLRPLSFFFFVKE